ncbi:MAG: sigma-54-dependent Fis family transcriptional regulator [Planctomycetes bacterium]|nr:sigma-54-dependent Fis family transcriptional regulator [Planctomycetota bacterium]
MSGGDEPKRGLAAWFGFGGAGDEATAAGGAQLKRLLEINQALAAELDKARLYSKILDAAVELTGAERAFLVLSSAGDEEPAVAASRNVDREEIRSAISKVSKTVVRKVVESGATQRIESALDDPSLQPSQSISGMRLVSILAVPLKMRGTVLGCLYLDNRFQRGIFTPDHQQLMELFADQAAVAVENARLMAQNAAARVELEQLNGKLSVRVAVQEVELQSMRDALMQRPDATPPRHDYPEIIGRSPSMLEMLRLLDVVVETDYPVLILGESGVGKEVVARAIHRLGRRATKAFLAENCAAIAENLLEAELFGYVKGAFTGADKDKRGLFEEAHGGTLFLDEIGDMEVAMQRKLLRVLQEGEFRKVGGHDSIKVDVRILSATNADLARKLEDGSFREDLYFRLKVMTVRVPPLRERRGDIPALIDFFLRDAAKRTARPPPEVTPEALQTLCNYAWPGNVRELKNEVLKLVALSDGKIEPRHLRGLGEGTRPIHLALAGRTLEDLEKEAIRQALEAARGKRIEAARLLGLPRRTFYNRLKKYGLL